MALPLALARNPDVIGPKRTATLLALLEIHQRDGRATVRAVAGRLGIGFGGTHWQLECLAADGLVAGTHGDPVTRGALRPLVEVVANGCPAH